MLSLSLMFLFVTFFNSMKPITSGCRPDKPIPHHLKFELKNVLSFQWLTHEQEKKVVIKFLEQIRELERDNYDDYESKREPTTPKLSNKPIDHSYVR